MSSIGDYVDSPSMENEEHIATTSVALSGEAISTHLPPSKHKIGSQAWNHFTEVPNSGQMAKCHYCGNLIKFKDGTNVMTMHLKRCKEHPDNQQHKRQKASSSTKPTKEELGVVSSPHSMFDQEACRLELVKMFVGAELPFRFMENMFFRNFVNVLQPQFDIPSRATLSITVDNAPSNNVGNKFMKKLMNARNCLLLNGEYTHMRCCAHILSLIVNEGLKYEDISITRIRKAVKYVRSSPSRLARFKGCVEREKISYKGLICLDVETRWNSTYLMLVMVVIYKKAFDLLEIVDAKYVKELSKAKGPRVPLSKDMDFANTVLPFLRIFYDATMRISGSSYVTSNIYMKEIFAIGRKIQLLSEHNDASIKSMGISMKSKYDKYWGNVD
ncbi:zinc finger BED domain-containing protein RICESLEEPER 2-like [Cicer arietinum]|uniref:zinc finger BED domain-containing protein RICESLEEPER 2-like n=1 Tax=Cicer arietinum TaxID=3827 RepID=UPI003CC542FD